VRSRRLQIIIATTILAVLLWASVNLGTQYQTVVSVPLRVTNIPSGQALRFPVPEELRLTVRGEGWQLLSMSWNSPGEIPLDVHRASVSHQVLTMKDFLRELTLPNGIDLVDLSPESLFVSLDDSGEKKVPVVLNADVSCAEGYGLADPPMLAPDSVTVRGALSVLLPIEHVRTEHMVYHSLKTTLDRSMTLENNVPIVLAMDPPAVRVLINVQPFAEKTMTGIPVEVTSVPDNREVILVPPRMEILVRGGINRLAEISSSDCTVRVDFAQLLDDTTRTVIPRVELPEGVSLIARRPEVFQFVIRKRL
jgi:YbbR domain-containing protein